MAQEINIKMLLIETEEDTIAIFVRFIEAEFPQINLSLAHTPDDAMDLLHKNKYEIVVCDAFLKFDPIVFLVSRICTEAIYKPILIVISGDTNIMIEKFSHVPKNMCVQNVIYKPVDINDLFNKIQDAIDTLEHREQM